MTAGLAPPAFRDGPVVAACAAAPPLRAAGAAVNRRGVVTAFRALDACRRIGAHACQLVLHAPLPRDLAGESRIDVQRVADDVLVADDLKVDAVARADQHAAGRGRR